MVLAKALLVSDTGTLSRNAAAIGVDHMDSRVVTEFTRFRASFRDAVFDDMWGDDISSMA
jgi:hypothetical protein